MRVLYLHQYFTPPQGSSGTRSYEFARRLIAAGHDVCVITSAAFLPECERQSDSLVYRTIIDGVPLVVINVPYRNEMPFSARIQAFLRFAALSALEALRQPADVIFATSTPLTIAIPGLLAALLKRIPMVFEVRDLWPELPIAMGALRNPFARWAAKALEWAAYHGAAHIITLSPGMTDGVMRRGIPAERVTTIPNSCDIDLFDVPPERGYNFRQRIPNLGIDQPLVVYTGSFGKIYGITYLVDMAKAMQAINPEVCFLLVGSGEEKRQVIVKAQSNGTLDQNLFVWEPLPKTEIPDLLSAATIALSLVIPIQSLWNNSANKFFDALAAGKPVAINYEGWQAELLSRSGAGLVLPPNDPASAAKLLASFLQDSERVKKAGVAAKDLAHAKFHRDEMARQLEEILHQAVVASQKLTQVGRAISR